MSQENMTVLDSEKEEKVTESEKMIECLKSGDDEAFGKFYESYKAPLYDFLSKRTKHTQYIEDIISETFMAAVKNIDSLRDAQKFEQWLKAIAVNEMYAYIKKENKHSENRVSGDYSEIAEVVDDETIMLPEDFSADEEKKQLVADAVNSLSETQREAIYCYYYIGMSISEIAQMTNVSENTVKSRMLLAKKHLKRRLEKLKKQGYMFSAFPISVLFVELGDMVNVSFLTTASVASPSSAGFIGGISVVGVSAAVLIGVTVLSNFSDDLDIDNTRGDKKPTDHSSSTDTMPDLTDSMVINTSNTSYLLSMTDTSSDIAVTALNSSASSGAGANTNTNNNNNTNNNTNNNGDQTDYNDNNSDSDTASNDDWDVIPIVNENGEQVPKRYFSPDKLRPFSFFYVIYDVRYKDGKLAVKYSFEPFKSGQTIYLEHSFSFCIYDSGSDPEHRIYQTPYSTTYDVDGYNTALAMFTVPSSMSVEEAANHLTFLGTSEYYSGDDYGYYQKQGDCIYPSYIKVPLDGNFVANEKLSFFPVYGVWTKEISSDSTGYSSLRPVFSNYASEIKNVTLDNCKYLHFTDGVLYNTSEHDTEDPNRKAIIWAPENFSVDSLSLEDNVTVFEKYALDRLHSTDLNVGRNVMLLQYLPDNFQNITVKLGSNEDGKYFDVNEHSDYNELCIETLRIHNMNELKTLTITSDVGNLCDLQIRDCKNLETVTIDKDVEMYQYGFFPIMRNCDNLVFRVYRDSSAAKVLEEWASGLDLKYEYID